MGGSQCHPRRKPAQGQVKYPTQVDRKAVAKMPDAHLGREQSGRTIRLSTWVWLKIKEPGLRFHVPRCQGAVLKFWHPFLSHRLGNALRSGLNRPELGRAAGSPASRTSARRPPPGASLSTAAGRRRRRPWLQRVSASKSPKCWPEKEKETSTFL